MLSGATGLHRAHATLPTMTNWVIIMTRWAIASGMVLGLLLDGGCDAVRADVVKTEYRAPADESELRYWLANMQAHRFTLHEMSLATGLSQCELTATLSRLVPTDVLPSMRDKLQVLPYPGGRHPRIGFREGAIRPQRETKISIFPPWPDGGYVVVDVPEAVWCDRGLLYLAHTHVPTLWSRNGASLERLEWNRHGDGSLEIKRTLPNKVEFGARIVPRADHVDMRLWLSNGSDGPLADLRVQMCAMLGSLKGFEAQSNDNKLFDSPYAACRDQDGQRWVIMAWSPVHRVWGNARCPCLHSDPQFPDCRPGERRELRGRLWFYEGLDVASELRSVDATHWQAEQKDP